jgi:hypothetical protein
MNEKKANLGHEKQWNAAIVEEWSHTASNIMGAWRSLLLINNQRGEKRNGNKRKVVNNKTYLYPQNSTFGLGTIEFVSESKRKDGEYFFISIHRSALPRVWVSWWI